MPETIQVKISQKTKWKDFFLLTFLSPKMASLAEPGQFIMVRVMDLNFPLLRRPISIHSSDGTFLEIFFQESGVGTRILADKNPGDQVDILGPLGKGFVLGKDLEKKKIALIGGGRGIAPLYFLADRLQKLDADITVFYGGKTSAEIPLKQRFKQKGFRILCSTDDGSDEFKGFVTELLDREIEENKPDLIFSCGPDLMMEKIADMAEKRNIPSQFSLESHMGCGFGACWGCVRQIRKNNKPQWIKICEDGPVFQGKEIIWQPEKI